MFVYITLLLEQLLGEGELAGVHRWNVGDLEIVPIARTTSKSPVRAWILTQEPKSQQHGSGLTNTDKEAHSQVTVHFRQDSE